MANSPNKIKKFLILVIVLTLGSLISIFIGFRILSKQPEILIKTIKDHATLSIDNLHQTATRNGKQEWTLDAKSAHLIQAENRSVLENLSIVFFMKNQQNAHLTAVHGVLENNTSDFQVSGQVVLKNPEYRLKTEKLHYKHKDRIMFTTAPADISGKSLHFSADKMTFNLDSNKAQLEGNVKGTISGQLNF